MQKIIWAWNSAVPMRPAMHNERKNKRERLPPLAKLRTQIQHQFPYFNFTKSRTKIAHTPTVSGNIANCAFCMEFPRGNK